MEAQLLGPLERRVMDHLWRSGPSTVRQTRDCLNGSSLPPVAYTTVMTILVRLHHKGYLMRRRQGRQFEYAAAIDEASLPAAAGRRELRRLIERYGAARLAGFAADLAQLDDDLAARLRALAPDGAPKNS